MKNQLISAEAERIIKLGGIGRANSYKRLLRYLAKRASDTPARPPKEIEIAKHVFGKEINPHSTDSSTRVYIHNLRSKLSLFYAKKGQHFEQQLEIPTGSYSLILVRKKKEYAETKFTKPEIKPPLPPSTTYFKRKILALFVAGVLLGSLMTFGLTQLFITVEKTKNTNQENIFWREFKSNGMPSLIVLGDTFFFAEYTGDMATSRIVHHFSVNSINDFQKFISNSKLQSDIETYPDSIRFVSNGTLQALMTLVQEYAFKEPLNIKLASEISANDIRNNNIIFIGQFRTQQNIQTLYKDLPIETLPSLANIKIKGTDEVLNQEGRAAELHKDYGMFSQHIGSNGNHIVTFGSLQDTALKLMVRQVSNNHTYTGLITNPAELSQQAVIFEVTGLNRSDLDAKIIKRIKLDEQKQ